MVDKAHLGIAVQLLDAVLHALREINTLTSLSPKRPCDGAVVIETSALVRHLGELGGGERVLQEAIALDGVKLGIPGELLPNKPLGGAKLGYLNLIHRILIQTRVTHRTQKNLLVSDGSWPKNVDGHTHRSFRSLVSVAKNDL